jgi:caffeoyl-CoA O-methyltransferase
VSEPKSFFLTSELHDYLLAHCTQPDEVLRWIIEETPKRVPEVMRTSSIPPEQGAFMTLITSVLNVENALEVGTFTGYSSICIARGLAPGGRLLCCDIEPNWTATAREAWKMAGLDDRIELRLGPAIDTLRALPTEPSIDLAFLDADKGNHAAYYQEIVPRIRPNGVILVDNTLWFGHVLADQAPDDETVAVREFNDMVTADERVESMIVTIGDGLTLIRKRESAAAH